MEQARREGRVRVPEAIGVGETGQRLLLRYAEMGEYVVGILRNFPTEKISLIKQDGQCYDNTTANVQPETIFVDNVQLQIEEGDTFERTLPNGLLERYVVLDRGYYGRMRGIPAHYQVKVRKESTLTAQQPTTTTIYNLTGANPRVNVNSVDQSVNVVTAAAPTVFEEMKQAIIAGVEDGQRQTELLHLVDGLEQAKDGPAFLDRYKEFIASAADHLTVLMPFLPALAQMLNS